MELKLGAILKKLRNEKGVTQEEVAEYVGVSFQAVSKWETDTTMPDIALLPKLATYFGVKIDDLFSINVDDEMARIDYMLDHTKLTDKNFTYAKQTLDSFLQNNENDVDAIKRYVKLLLKKNSQDNLKAGNMLEKAMSITPQDSEIFVLYRQARGGDRNAINSGNDWFIRVCQQYAYKNPDNIKLCEMLIEAMIEMRYFDKATEIISLIKIKNDYASGLPEIFRGDIALAQGNLSEAIRIWDSIDSNNHKAQYEAGERFSRINEYERAIICFKNSFNAASKPRDLSAMYSLAFLYTKLKMYQNAIDAWQCIIDVLESDYGTTEGETVEWPKREIEKLKTLL